MASFKAQFATARTFHSEFSEREQSFTSEMGGVTEVTTSDHNKLTNRDLPDQHPIQAIVGLEGELGDKLESIPAMTNEDIENILKGFM